MKKQFIVSLAVLAASVVTGSTVYAQDATSTTPIGFKTWSIGVNAGVLMPNTPIGGQKDFHTGQAQLGYGLYIKKQFTPYFSLRLDGLRGNVKGDNIKPIAEGNLTAPMSFKTNLEWSGTLNAVFNLFNIDMFHKNNALQLYASAGAGLAGYKPTLYDHSGTVSTDPNLAGNHTFQALTIPVGVGAKFKISESVNFDLGYTTHFVNTDNFDGYKGGTTNDKFSYAYAGLEFALGGRGKKQLAFHNPVAETYDAMVKANQSLKGELATQRQMIDELSKDSDGDGVPDKFDKCPNTPSGVKVDGSGCPLPSTPAPVIVKEKTIVTETDRRIVKEAIKNLEFETGKAVIKESSLPSLDRVADLLTTRGFSLKLAGHTDNTGSKELNMRLSKERAEAVRSYLVDKGANASRIEAVGYGQNQPIATNKTAAGRQQNRRVEFTIY